VTIRFVDAGGNDANDGLDNIGVGLATATWTNGTFTLTQAGHGYTFAAGDVIYLASGTGLTPGLYEVASSTVNTIVLVETSTLRDVGDASDVAAGDDATGDWASSDGALLTADAGMNAVAAGDVVYLRNDQDYRELVTIDTAGTTTNAIRFQGYGTSLDDAGRATIDAQDARTNCVADSLGSTGGYYVFQNIIFHDATGVGVFLSLNVMVFKNCHFTSHTGDGLDMGNGAMVESCLFSSTAKGMDVGNNTTVVGSKFLNCTDGVECTYGTIIDCIFYNASGNAIEFIGANGFSCVVYSCTIDGNAGNTTNGISFSGNWGPFTAVNNIIYDCGTGINGHANGGKGRLISRNNLLNSNGADYDSASYETFIGEVTGAPAFTAEGSQDYTLASSPAVGVGFDANAIDGSAQEKDIGALQKAISGAGGGLLVHPGTSGGMRG